MKRKKFNQKLLCLVLCAVSAMLLCAWNEKKVELLDQLPLIDLDKAIEAPKPGAIPDHQTAPTETAETTATTTSTDSRIIYISVQWETILYQGKECRANELAEKMKKDFRKNTTFKLIDDYAEAHKYKEVYEILNRQKQTYGMNVQFGEE